MIDGRFDQNFLELFAHRQRLRQKEPKAFAFIFTGVLLALAGIALLLV